MNKIINITFASLLLELRSFIFIVDYPQQALRIVLATIKPTNDHTIKPFIANYLKNQQKHSLITAKLSLLLALITS